MQRCKVCTESTGGLRFILLFIFSHSQTHIYSEILALPSKVVLYLPVSLSLALSSSSASFCSFFCCWFSNSNFRSFLVLPSGTEAREPQPQQTVSQGKRQTSWTTVSLPPSSNHQGQTASLNAYVWIFTALQIYRSVTIHCDMLHHEKNEWLTFHIHII